MKFENSYFDDEVKAGFFVDSKMKCCWAAQLEVLNEIDKVCRKYHIQYFAEYGTLLGTVRHGGFIPWDDDMDICMKRRDYDKFLKVAPKEFPETFDILNYHNQEDYWDVMSRVVNSRSIVFTPDFLDKYHNMPYICGVDIFPMDYLARDKSLVETQKDLVDYIKSVADVNGLEGMDPEELESHLCKIEGLSNQKIDRNGDMKIQLYKIVNGLYAIYGEAESDELAMMPLYLTIGGNSYPKEYFADSIRMPFENTTIPVPIGYDHLLKKKYGDYMRSIRRGGTHDYPYYEKQEEYLSEKGTKLPKYEYPGTMEGRVKNPTFKKSADDRVNLLAEVHEKLEMLLKYGELETTLKLLQECQNIAVGIGESIEKKVGEGTEAVACLEQYCEVLFQLYDPLSQNMALDGTEVKNILNKVLGAIKTSVKTLPIKREIVFMPYKAEHWKNIESVWKAACEDEECEVKVVPIPYFYKKRMGQDVSQAFYEGDKFPEYVPITPFSEYNVGNNHPDQIYIQTPCDEWNYTVSVHPNYYSAELWKDTEELIYIPWFKIDEMNPQDARGLKSRRYFVSMPGVVNADKIIVQSEAMKESYVEFLCEWAGEDTKNIWESKILGLGAPIDDQKTEPAERPSEWENKRIIVYHISGNSIMEHKEKLFNKIKDTMAKFEQQSDNVQIVWLQDVALMERYGSRIPRVLGTYKKMLEEYGKKDWVSIVEPDKAEEMTAMADAYYGDGGRFAEMMKQASKPVLLQRIG